METLLVKWRSLRREHRTLTLGLGVLILISLFGKARVWLAWSRQQFYAAAELQRTLNRVRDDLRSYPATHDSARALRLQLGNEFHSLLQGTTTPATEAALIESIHEAADAAGVRLGSVSVNTDTSQGDKFYAHPRGALEATGDVRGVTTFLAALEGNESRIRLVSMNISQSEPFAESRRSEALHLTLIVEGLGRRATRERTVGRSGR